MDIVEIADISQLTGQLSRQRPDVLVVSPASLGFCTPQQLRVQTGCEGLRCIALEMSVTDAATLNAYDDVLSVYDPVEAKPTDLKRIIIRYYPSGSTNELTGVLFDIFTCERDLASHNDIEDRLFIPAIKRLEERTGSGVSGTQPGDMPPKQPAPKKGGCR